MRYAFVTLLIISSSGCYSMSPSAEDNSIQTTAFVTKLVEIQLICEVFMEFHVKNNKWPDTYDEVAGFSEQILFTIPSWFQEQYRGRCFKSSDDGSLHMEFNLVCEDIEGNDIVSVLPVTLSKSDSNLDESDLKEMLKLEIQQ